MRRIQIYLEESVDDALQAESVRTGRSKASLIRECVAVRFGDANRVPEDPLDALVGAFDVDPASIDEVVYGSLDLHSAADELEVAEPRAAPDREVR
jgi:hypothetical protein